MLEMFSVLNKENKFFLAIPTSDIVYHVRVFVRMSASFSQ